MGFQLKKTLYNGRLGSVTLHTPYLWPSVRLRVGFDDHSFVLAASLAPLFEFDFELYFAKNYWVQRGVYVNAILGGTIEIETALHKGEKKYVEDESDERPNTDA